MFKSATISLSGPSIQSQTKGSGLKTISPKKIGANRKKIAQAKTLALTVPALSVLFIAGIVSLLALHLYFVNIYSAKGIAITNIEESIAEQNNLQKKLMFKQAQLNSTITFAGVDQKGLVPITYEEYLTSNQLTSR